MSKEEIVEGLRAALSRGESLNKAMMTFYNSGYSKQDIEAAARQLENPQMPPRQYASQYPQYQQPMQPPQRPMLRPQQQVIMPSKPQLFQQQYNPAMYQQQPIQQPMQQQMPQYQPKPVPQVKALPQAPPQQVIPQQPVEVQPQPVPVQPKPQPAQIPTVTQPEIHAAPQPITPFEEQAYQPLQQAQPTQIVSSYGQKPSRASAVLIFILVFFLLVLIGALISVFLFREELSSLLGGFL